jgi:hypothetical protein
MQAARAHCWQRQIFRIGIPNLMATKGAKIANLEIRFGLFAPSAANLF